MKTLRQLCVVVVFTLALAVPAFAGEMHIGSPTPPPSQPQTATVNGEMQIGLTGQEETGSGEVSATDSATETVLNLLQSVLSLF
jgi:hypothetical protein